MSIYCCKLHMADALWRFELPLAFRIPARYHPFLTQEPGADCTLSFRLGAPPAAEGVCVHGENPHVLRTGGGYLAERGGSAVWFSEADPRRLYGWLDPARAAKLCSLDFVMNAANLEQPLLSLGAVCLHSSLIETAGGAILFTAPSGTGKSTQAALWETHRNAEQINGDRAVIRRKNGVWTAYGFPYAGSSCIYKNRSAPIRAIVVLRQAPENTIVRLRPAEAFRLLYSETAIQRWNERGHAEAADLLIRLASERPVYRLACTPDVRAVALLERTLHASEASV